MACQKKYALYLHCLHNYWFYYESYPQVYLEECKYKVKKIQISRFINAELELDSDLDSEELTTKLESNSDSE